MTLFAGEASALENAEHGWHVFPCDRDKRPLVRHGFRDATRDPRVIREMWSRDPEANVGGATGKLSGRVVLDVDSADVRPRVDVASCCRMSHFRSVVTLATLLAVAPLSSAYANGIDLPARAAAPGTKLVVEGHDWLGCCPPRTPVAHVRLFLLDGGRRVRLFDARPTAHGVIRASFRVPNIESGSYALEACSEGLQGGDEEAQPICLPEGRLRVLGAAFLPSTGPGLRLWLILPVAMTTVGVLLVVVTRARRRSTRALDSTLP
jgi:hypothetical protein